jgi:hypothetical protein
MMREMGPAPSRPITAVLAAATLVAAAALLPAARVWALTSAEVPSPGPTPALEVDGQVEGVTRAGGRLSMRVDASMAGGWRGLHVVGFSIHRGDDELERVSLDVDNSRLVIGGGYLLVGTDAVGLGTYLRVPASEVVITTGGDHLSAEITADVLRTIPDGASFQLSATDDSGATEAVVRGPSPRGSEGLGWGTVLAVVIAAVLVGAFAGNLFASRRRPPPRLSVYGAVQRRIDEERSPVDGSR